MTKQQLDLSAEELQMISNLRTLEVAPLSWKQLNNLKHSELNELEQRVLNYLRTVGTYNLAASIYEVYEIGIASYPPGIDFQSNQSAYVTVFDFVGELWPRPSIHKAEPE